MKIILKNKSDVPIYEQIVEQIKNAVLGGKLTENEQLPSIRQLARDLKISVITTTRASAYGDFFCYSTTLIKCILQQDKLQNQRKARIAKHNLIGAFMFELS